MAIYPGLYFWQFYRGANWRRSGLVLFGKFMLELVVLSACLGNLKACDEAAKAYYKSKPQLHQRVRRERDTLERAVGREMVYLMLAGEAAAQKRIKLRYKKTTLLQIEKDSATLSYTFNF